MSNDKTDPLISFYTYIFFFFFLFLKDLTSLQFVIKHEDKNKDACTIDIFSQIILIPRSRETLSSNDLIAKISLQIGTFVSDDDPQQRSLPIINL